MTLQEKLNAKIKVLLQGQGSPLYTSKWVEKATPSGRAYLAHNASVKRTADRPWSTPRAQESHESPESFEARQAANPQRSRYNPTLGTQARMTAWATPNASQHNYNEDPDQFVARQEQRKADGKSAFSVPLGVQAQMVEKPWGTPMARGDNHHPSQRDREGDTGWLSDQARLAGFARLNPELVRWIMGYPKSWAGCVPEKNSKFRNVNIKPL